MEKGKKVILWDFDGTLVPFTSWRLAVMDVLNECETGHQIDQEQIRPFIRGRFPWHKPDESHLHLCSPDKWWQALEPIFISTFEGVGFTYKRSGELARQVRKHMTKPKRFALYPDTIAVLINLKERGWTQGILSNHMPELPGAVAELGLSPYIDFCITSATSGYEKPNPQAFRIAIEAASNPENVWMVGDNIVSDIKGAEAAGIPAILVHNPPVEKVRYYADTLTDVMKIIQSNPDISK